MLVFVQPFFDFISHVVLCFLNNDTLSLCSSNALLLNTRRLCIFTALKVQVTSRLPRMTVLLHINKRTGQCLRSCKSVPGPLELMWKLSSFSANAETPKSLCPKSIVVITV